MEKLRKRGIVPFVVPASDPDHAAPGRGGEEEEDAAGTVVAAVAGFAANPMTVKPALARVAVTISGEVRHDHC
jgi:hypothetical protein